ncbi:MAG: PRC-barrel domain-containing protein [Solirubrobacterales bacterium]
MVEETSSETELPGTDEALGWTGAKLDEISGSAIGRVEGVLVDAESGDPKWLLVRMGRFGHHSALPFSHVVAGIGRVWAPYDRDMVREAPRIDAGQPLSRERELELCGFYGIGEGTGRGAEIAPRPEGAVTAKPALPPT